MDRKYIILIVCLIVVFFFLNSPVNFPVSGGIKIEAGDSLRSVSFKLKQAHIIRSRLLFEAFVIIYGGEKHVMQSEYVFENKLPVYEVARRIGRGEHGLAPITVIIPEGFDTLQIADAFSLALPNFNKDKFMILAKDKEGYLFPDTYFFLKDDTETDVLRSMDNNFEKKFAFLRSEILALKKTEREIIIMASVIEREAKGNSDREIISGILWKRLSIDMALQVDAAPETYKTRDLPKNPISNPGILAIKAAIYPQKSAYLYYLHDKNGVTHYASTFSEHSVNIKKYLTQ